jgi:hypothetical protein
MSLAKNQCDFQRLSLDLALDDDMRLIHDVHLTLNDGHPDKILTSGRLTLGEYARDFERQFADAARVRRAVAVNSGTSALEIALRAHGLEQGEEVIVPTNSFDARAMSVVLQGAGHDRHFDRAESDAERVHDDLWRGQIMTLPRHVTDLSRTLCLEFKQEAESQIINLGGKTS